MAYGLQVTSYDAGGNSIIQIDTELGLSNYVIVESGRASTVIVENTVKDRVILVRPINDNPVYILDRPSGGQPGVITFVADDYWAYANEGVRWHKAYQSQDVDYMILEDVSGVTPVGDYGLQVKQPNGDTAFDSRCITTDVSCQITSVVPRDSVSGYGGGSNSRLTTDINAYVSMNWSEWLDLGVKDGIIRKDNGVTDGIYYYSIVEDEGPFEDDREDVTYFYTNFTNILIANQV